MEKINIKLLIITVFCISWVGVLPSLLIAYKVDIPAAVKALDILMMIGPLLGAVIFIAKAQGKEGLKCFFKKLLQFKAAPIGIAVAILLPILISFLSAAIGLKLSGSAWPDKFSPDAILIDGLMITLVYLFINTEELAWRGVVFDALLEKYSYIKACMILAPIWFLFHVPLFLYPNGHPAGYGLVEFGFMVVAQTFILGWIYAKTSKSLVYVHLHHQLINGFGQAFPIFPIFIGGDKMPVWTLCVLLPLAAGILVASGLMGKKQEA